MDMQTSGSAINEQMSLLELRERLAAAQQREREEVSTSASDCKRAVMRLCMGLRWCTIVNVCTHAMPCHE